MKEVWEYSITMLNDTIKWDGNTLSKTFKIWYEDKEVSDYRSLPIVII